MLQIFREIPPSLTLRVTSNPFFNELVGATKRRNEETFVRAYQRGREIRAEHSSNGTTLVETNSVR